MSQFPKVFISFSSKDQNEVRKLFSALEIQNVKVWDYSGAGQELPLAHQVSDSLKKRIDECDYFIAIISPITIDEEIGRHTRFEVRYAIECGKLQPDRILPVLINNPADNWLSLYDELKSVLRINNLDTDNPSSFEDNIRKICEWLSVSYVPSSLRDSRVFFAQLFLKEAEGEQLENSHFVQLMTVMNNCATDLVAENWLGVKNKVNLFLNLIDMLAPRAGFYYPLVIRGVSELQLSEFENAEQTFLQATENHNFESNPLIGLGFAGLGHAYFSLGKYNESQNAFQKALSFLPDEDDIQYGDDVQFNLLGALIQADVIIFDETVLDKFDLSKIPLEDRLKVITLKGAAKYKKGKYRETILVFSEISRNELDETSAIYYALALKECGCEEDAIDILNFAADKIKTANLYHHLADTYLCTGRIQESLRIYEDILCNSLNRADWIRQYFIEYAQILKSVNKIRNYEKILVACEKVLDSNSFPLPNSKEDFFYTGFAYYLLDKHKEARFDYNRSLDFCDQYYDEIELCEI
ncbi:MAG: TIR domain-containing protein [Acidobacteriota bacterium]|nr:TIR domain-containing protein [Acidobacteriota bacterium]